MPAKENELPMSKRSLGSLADLARILEEASNPESAVREDRKESKPKTLVARKMSRQTQRSMDPKRKAWYDKRLREQQAPKASAPAPAVVVAEPAIKLPANKQVASRMGGALNEILAAAKDSKNKDDKKKIEPWKRKPGDPIF